MTLKLDAEQKQGQCNLLQNNLQTTAEATEAIIISARQCWKKQNERWDNKICKEVHWVMKYPKEDKVLEFLKLSD